MHSVDVDSSVDRDFPLNTELNKNEKRQQSSGFSTTHMGLVLFLTHHKSLPHSIPHWLNSLLVDVLLVQVKLVFILVDLKCRIYQISDVIPFQPSR